MPSCAICGTELKCGVCAHSIVGSPAKACPLSKGSVWVHVVDDENTDVPLISILCDGKTLNTTVDGIAQFQPLAPNPYAVEMLKLSPGALKLFVPPAVLPHDQVKVDAGQMVYVPFGLVRLAALQVHVKFATEPGDVPHPVTLTLKDALGSPDLTATTAKDHAFAIKPGDYRLLVTLPPELAAFECKTAEIPLKLVPGPNPLQTIELVSPGSLEFVIQTSNGVVLPFDVNLKALGPKPFDGPALAAKALIPTAGKGKYNVSLTLPPGVADLFAAPVIPEIDLLHGENKSIPIVLQARSLPVVDFPAPKVLIVRQPYHGQPVPGVPAHRVAVRLSATPSFDGTGELTAPAGVEVFDTAVSTVVLASPLPLTALDLKGRTVFLEASAPSPANLGSVLNLKLIGGSVPPRPAVDTPFTCVKLTLDVFAATGVNPAALDPASKLSPGRGVVVAGKRAKVVLSQAAPADFDGQILLQPLANRLAFFADEVPAGGQLSLAGPALSFANSALGAPKTLWTSATAVSLALADEGWFAAVEGVEHNGALVEGDRVALTAITLTLEMFTGAFTAGNLITVAPFYPIDDAASLDAPLPDAEHNVPVDARPPLYDAAFAAPPITLFDDHPAGNADPKVFRFRLRVAPDIAAIPDTTLDLKIRVLSKAGTAPTVVGPFSAPLNSASHANGMVLKLEKKPGAHIFLSPYCRVMTIAFLGRSKMPEYAIIHSLPSLPSQDPALGVQLGRQLKAAVESFGVNGDYTLGGEPFATVPIQFYYVNDLAPEAKFNPIPTNKIHQLNQYWAASGIEFCFADPLQRLIHRPPPLSSLLSIGESNGAASVANHPIDLTVELGFTTAGGSATASIDILQHPANSTSLDLANALATAVRLLTFPNPPHAGLTFDADILDLVQPRCSMSFDLGLCRSDVADPSHHSMTVLPHRVALPLIGTAGPVDVNFRAHATSAIPLTNLKINSIIASHSISGAIVALDLTAPDMTKNDHAVLRNPPDVITRHWIRRFEPAASAHVSVVFEGPLCRSLDTGSRTLLNPGIWNEPDAHLICYMHDSCLQNGPDDVQHELAHALTGHNHTLFHPKWFYNAELLRNGSGEPSNKSIHLTERRIFVDGLDNFGGAWHAALFALDHGYGGAARAGIPTLNAQWVNANPLAPTQLPW